MLWIFASLACSNGPDIYESCESPDTCEVPEDQTAECVDDGGDGFCTWACKTDADCNPPDDYHWAFQCAPFQSSKGSHCFPACDGAEDPDAPSARTATDAAARAAATRTRRSATRARRPPSHTLSSAGQCPHPLPRFAGPPPRLTRGGG